MPTFKNIADFSALTNDQIERVWSYVDKRDNDQCWESQLAQGAKYATIRINRKVYPHTKLVYVITHKCKLSPIHSIYNTCGNTRCCNPDHMEVRTFSQIQRLVAEAKKTKIEV